MRPTMRMYRDDEDYWRIRAFLREIFPLNSREQTSWTVTRWDHWRVRYVVGQEAAVLMLRTSGAAWRAP